MTLRPLRWLVRVSLAILLVAGMPRLSRAAPPPTLPGYQVNIAVPPIAPNFVYGQVPMWIDTTNTSVGSYGLPRPASAEYPLPVATSPSPGSAGSGAATPSYNSPGAVTPIQSGGTTNATAGTFNQILGAASGNTRTVCWINNTSTDYLYIFFASAAQPTPTPTNSDPIGPGQSYPCNLGGVVAQNAIWLAAKTISNATYTLKYFQ